MRKKVERRAKETFFSLVGLLMLWINIILMIVVCTVKDTRFQNGIRIIQWLAMCIGNDHIKMVSWRNICLVSYLLHSILLDILAFLDT